MWSRSAQRAPFWFFHLKDAALGAGMSLAASWFHPSSFMRLLGAHSSAEFALSFSGFGYFIPFFVPYACGARDGLPDSVCKVVRSRCKTSE